MIDVHLLAECLRHNWPIYDPSKPNGYRGGPFDMDAAAMARTIVMEYDQLHDGYREAVKWGPPEECPTGKHDFYVHEYNTPCYGFDGEINLPPGTVHCRNCFKVKGARRRAAA